MTSFMEFMRYVAVLVPMYISTCLCEIDVKSHPSFHPANQSSDKFNRLNKEREPCMPDRRLQGSGRYFWAVGHALTLTQKLNARSMSGIVEWTRLGYACLEHRRKKIPVYKGLVVLC